MRSLRLVLRIFAHHIWFHARTGWLELQLATRVVLFLFVVVPALVGLTTSVFLFRVPAHVAETNIASGSGLEPWILLALGAYALFTPFLSTRHLAIQSYQLYPIREWVLTGVAGIYSLVRVRTFLAISLLVALWIKNVLPHVPARASMVWLLLLTSLLVASHWVGDALRLLRGQNSFAFLTTIALGTGAWVLELVLGLPTTRAVSAALAATMAGGGASSILSSMGGILWPLVAAGTAIGASFEFWRSRVLVELRRERASGTPGVHLLARCDRLWRRLFDQPLPLSTLVTTEIRLLFRNTRTKFFVVNIFVYVTLGAGMFLVGPYLAGPLQWLYLCVGTIYLVSFSSLAYTAHAYRIKCNHFDGLFARPLSPSRLCQPILHVSIVATVAGLVPWVLVLCVISPSHVVPILAFGTYNLGVAVPVFMVTATQETQPYEPNLGAFDMSGAFVSKLKLHYAVLLGISMLPLIIPLFLSGLAQTLGYVAVGTCGVAGMMARPWWISLGARRLHQKKYSLLSSFR